MCLHIATRHVGCYWDSGSETQEFKLVAGADVDARVLVVEESIAACHAAHAERYRISPLDPSHKLALTPLLYLHLGFFFVYGMEHGIW